jgi:acyl transferase domain-containing protein/2-polyprenyl-3-methyl-5-hydroxy-6-metoxy-1,4-benzoquinol methylase
MEVASNSNSKTEELQRDEETSRVNEVALSTAMCVAVQVAIVRLLRSWGVVPVAVTSHSSGEVAAACTAGAISLKRAMAIVYFRGELAGALGLYITGKGGMVAVGLGTDGVEPYLKRVTLGEVGVACINSPNSVTISGDVSAIEELETMLLGDKVFARRLKINAAYHSHHMAALGKPYLEFLNKSEQLENGDHEHLNKSGQLENGHLKDIVYTSPTTGKQMSSIREIRDPGHWVRSLTQPVQFVKAFTNMCFPSAGGDFAVASIPFVDAVIEIGPHAALSGPIQEIVSMLPAFASTEGKPSYFTALIRKSSAVATMHTLACNLLRSGYPVDLKAINFPNAQDQVDAKDRSDIRVLHDLPKYPWNHQIRHWTESKANISLRTRQQPPHDLLGSLALNTNMMAPTWRHIIRATDIPWVRDHIVQSNMVYPGAGYIAMAIEGALELFRLRASAQDGQGRGGGQKKKQHILGYQLRDIDILQALIIPDTRDGVEVQLSLRPCSDKPLYAVGWQEFQVSSVTVADDLAKWTEHCKGRIMVEAADDTDALATESQYQSTSGSGITRGKPTKEDYRLRVEPRDIYAGMRSGGICHGPIFQNLHTIRAREKESVSSFVVADTAATMPSQYQQPHVIHPTTLDSIFQAAYTALPGAGSQATSPQIPRSINKLWISHRMSSEPGHHFHAYSRMKRADLQSFDAEIEVVNDADGDRNESPVLAMSGFLCQSIGNTIQADDSQANEKYGLLKWAPDISFLKSGALQKELSYPVDATEADVLRDLQRSCIYFITDVLAALSASDVAQLEVHHKKFYVWMKLQIELALQDRLAPGSSKWITASREEKEALIATAGAASVNGEMVCRLGPELLRILRREVTPLEVMVEGKLLYRYYETALKYDRSSQQIGKLVKHFVHKNPRAKILEIGGGTGGTTTHVLGAIGTDDSELGPLASSYDFTDISSGFFEAAQEKLKAWKNLVRYKKLDIEQDATKQGFEEGTYDLVVACQVLHATKSMKNTMTNVRKLLKPGGKLLLLETTQDHVDLQFVFGLVPGWWLSMSLAGECIV